MNLFIDECLSDELTQMAIDRGHWGSASVKRRGLAGTKDWNLLPLLMKGDFTLVTRNATDFRGSADDPGAKGLYANQELHPGLICLNGPASMDVRMQRALFSIALDELEALGNDLTNRGLEVTLASDDADAVIRVYDLPKP